MVDDVVIGQRKGAEMEQPATPVQTSPPVRDLGDGTYVVHVRTDRTIEHSEKISKILHNLKTAEVVRGRRTEVSKGRSR